MTVTSLNHRPTSYPPSTSTAPDRCHVPGHDKAARLGETPRRHEKNATSEGKADDPGNRFPGRGRLGRREQPAHEPLILRATPGKVPLTGLFFRMHLRLTALYANGHRRSRVSCHRPPPTSPRPIRCASSSSGCENASVHSAAVYTFRGGEPRAHPGRRDGHQRSGGGCGKLCPCRSL
jgi:hypothetical protein